MQMHEIQGLPALFFDNLPEEIGSETHEVLYNDPLHYIFHYTQNLYNELSKHLPKIQKRVQTNLFMHLLFEKMQKILQITEKIY